MNEISSSLYHDALLTLFSLKSHVYDLESLLTVQSDERPSFSNEPSFAVFTDDKFAEVQNNLCRLRTIQVKNAITLASLRISIKQLEAELDMERRARETTLRRLQTVRSQLRQLYSNTHEKKHDRLAALRILQAVIKEIETLTDLPNSDSSS
eukprot:TRINITY_DN17169_c0_g1::TRINITY_DN17169_c0_g1_i1::g.11715::m.11715 TRINITY_DN17169_c0_g1::TRINITY_DN17169_c0_g1_i1::g.11715  ORF type:complete len:152 (-),score=-0.49,DUF4404/PF14357.1/0.041,DUF2421/PF10334.4/0.03,Kinetocho_Slk19/PF12709.2/9.3e+03,Kinetocho_Slk19/PF12709.2/8.3,Kinetocho_Slk19/PF12709.2/0.27,Plasmid_stabil/PF05016.9/1.6e+03,Plasmid_stabil/PF05016.9/0.21 TRINITY_DN17169_c0_g1_i1:461-916(-)